MSEKAPHPSTHEWKKMIATAALAGVTFKRTQPSRYGGLPVSHWRAFLPSNGPVRGICEAHSKYAVAAKALRIMEGIER